MKEFVQKKKRKDKVKNKEGGEAEMNTYQVKRQGDGPEPDDDMMTLHQAVSLEC